VILWSSAVVIAVRVIMSIVLSTLLPPAFSLIPSASLIVVPPLTAMLRRVGVLVLAVRFSPDIAGSVSWRWVEAIYRLRWPLLLLLLLLRRRQWLLPGLRLMMLFVPVRRDRRRRR
jgi:hypothetical protein